jgi:hypothetical protein
MLLDDMTHLNIQNNLIKKNIYLFFLQYTHIKLRQHHFKKTYNLVGFEPGLFCSVGWRNNNYATPPGFKTT